MMGTARGQRVIHMDEIDGKLIRAGQASYAICLATNGTLQLYYGDFRPQILPPWPSWLPGLAICARFVGVVLIASAVAVLARKKARAILLVWGGALLAFIPLFHVPYMLLKGPHPAGLGSWADTFNTLVLAGMAFVVAGSFREPNSDANRAPLVMRLREAVIPAGRVFFCTTIVAFGVCHFLYSGYIDTLVPSFWTYFAGVCLMGRTYENRGSKSILCNTSRSVAKQRVCNPFAIRRYMQPIA
jgi:hypothetical protein